LILSAQVSMAPIGRKDWPVFGCCWITDGRHIFGVAISRVSAMDAGPGLSAKNHVNPVHDQGDSIGRQPAHTLREKTPVHRDHL